MNPFIDSTLPGMSTALDIDAMLELFRRKLSINGGLELIGGKICDVQYRPGSQCRILYQLKFWNPASGRLTRQLLASRVLPDGESEPALTAAVISSYQALESKAIEIPFLRLPELQMVVYPFPVDPALPWLFGALDPTKVKRALKSIWAGQDLGIKRVKAQQLGYTPLARVALQYEVGVVSGDDGVSETRKLVGKIHAHKRPATLFAGARALWHAAQGRVGLASPVGYSSSLGLALQERVRGERLGSLVTGPSFGNKMRETARQIAVLHGLSLPLSAQRTPKKEAEVILRSAKLLAAICPDRAQNIERLSHSLAANIEADARMTGPVHGDFHPANVLADGDHVTLIDLDDVAYGDAYADVGRFLASLRVSALREFDNPSELLEGREIFLEEYLARTDGDARKARVFEAASLLLAASSPFRLQRPGWEQQATMLAEESERVIREARRGNPTPGFTPGFTQVGHQAENTLEIQDRIRWANDGPYVQALLNPYIEEAYGAEVTACLPALRRNTDSSFHTRYKLSGWKDGAKWALSLEGVGKKRGGRTFLRRLQSLRRSLVGQPAAPILPRPITYLSPLEIRIVEPPKGIALSSIIGTADALGAAGNLGRALAAVHNVDLDLGEALHPGDEISSMRRQVRGLKRTAPELYERASAALTETEKMGQFAPEQLVPSLNIGHRNRILCQGERIAIAEIEEITRLDQCIDLGNTLALITHMGIDQGQIHQAAEMANRFQEAYAESRELPLDGVALGEARALLSLACLQAKRDSDQVTARLLLGYAEAKLAK